MSSQEYRDQRLSLHSYRQGSEQEWRLPVWDHPLGQGIFPLFRRYQDRLYPIGTAFAVSRFGIIATARHCIDEALKHEATPPVEDATGAGSLQHNGLSILHYRRTAADDMRVSVWPLTNVSGALPADIVMGCLQMNQQPEPLLSLRLSPGLPETGSRVMTVGYRFEEHLVVDGIPLDAIKDHTFDWAKDYKHDLVVVEGTIQEVFLQRHRVVAGPCFSTSSKTYFGQSGGPVVNQAGDICGIHSASTVDDRGVASLLYPIVATNLRISVSLGGTSSIGFEQPIGVLMSTGAIRTDGTERLVRIVREEAGLRIDPIYRKDMRLEAYDDPHAHESGRPSEGMPLPHDQQ